MTRFHFVLPRFVQAQPGVYEEGSHLRLTPKEKNDHENIFVLYLSSIEPFHCEQMRNTRNVPKTVRGKLPCDMVYLGADNTFVL